MEFETVIGLEVHVELATRTKLFCSCPNEFGGEANTRVCPVCLGLPGSLPVINGEALRKHVMTALALGCRIPEVSRFDRKNYFYPDMPKNYQISQYELPVALGGQVTIKDNNSTKKIRLTRIHLEEDTGKSVHGGRSIASSSFTLLDYNRAGVPLMEIVSEPDMNSPGEAHLYLVELRRILTWLGVSDCRMEEGSLRCDANISLRPAGEKGLGTKTEIKNMNSFRGVRNALEFEEERQRKILQDGGRIVQETLGWDAGTNVAIPMRSKEEAHDYRYFPEPDLPPVRIPSRWKEKIRRDLPEMPEVMAGRFVDEFNIPADDAETLTSYRHFARFFEETARLTDDPRQVSNWMLGDISRYLNARDMEIQQTMLTPGNLSSMIEMIGQGVISGKIGKALIEILLEQGGNPREIVDKKGWRKISTGDVLMPLIQDVLRKNPDAVDSYLAGKESASGFLVGQLMAATRGRADPAVANRLIKEKLLEIHNTRSTGQ